MIVLNAFIDVKPECVDAFLALTKPLIAGSQQEIGNSMYVFYQNNAQFVVVEYWQDQAALDAHRTMPHYVTFVSQVGDLLAAPWRVESYSK